MSVVCTFIMVQLLSMTVLTVHEHVHVEEGHYFKALETVEWLVMDNCLTLIVRVYQTF